MTPSLFKGEMNLCPMSRENLLHQNLRYTHCCLGVMKPHLGCLWGAAAPLQGADWQRYKIGKSARKIKIGKSVRKIKVGKCARKIKMGKSGRKIQNRKKCEGSLLCCTFFFNAFSALDCVSCRLQQLFGSEVPSVHDFCTVVD